MSYLVLGIQFADLRLRLNSQAGFAVISGLGRGMAMTQTITAVQVVLSKRDLPVGNSIILFSQSMGGALFVSFSISLSV